MRLCVAAVLFLCLAIVPEALAQRIAGPQESSAILLRMVGSESNDSKVTGLTEGTVRGLDHRWSGAAIGGVTGAVVGALLGAVACSQDDTGDSNCVGVTVGAAALLALPGAILGGIIGASIPSN